VCGGGRYDDLVKSMGGPVAPAIGWAVGVDRLALVLKDKPAPDMAPKTFVVAAAKEAGEKSLRPDDRRARGRHKFGLLQFSN